MEPSSIALPVRAPLQGSSIVDFYIFSCWSKCYPPLLLNISLFVLFWQIFCQESSQAVAVKYRNIPGDFKSNWATQKSIDSGCWSLSSDPKCSKVQKLTKSIFCYRHLFCLQGWVSGQQIFISYLFLAFDNNIYLCIHPLTFMFWNYLHIQHSSTHFYLLALFVHSIFIHSLLCFGIICAFNIYSLTFMFRNIQYSSQTHVKLFRTVASPTESSSSLTVTIVWSSIPSNKLMTNWPRKFITEQWYIPYLTISCFCPGCQVATWLPNQFTIIKTGAVSIICEYQFTPF